jgi:hypothetical protein
LGGLVIEVDGTRKPGTAATAAENSSGGEGARGGEIILKTKARKTIFIAGLAGCMVLALLISLFAR